LPLDIVKIDKEFFTGDAEKGNLIVSSVIRLAKSLKMKIVAEGVEIKEQVDFLASENCDMIQGYYYAKPMPVKEFEELVARDA
jgi:EAL domain-containing protein (putative c-di-GMP-specific phosphodiesterase class I)